MRYRTIRTLAAITGFFASCTPGDHDGHLATDVQAPLYAATLSGPGGSAAVAGPVSMAEATLSDAAGDHPRERPADRQRTRGPRQQRRADRVRRRPAPVAQASLCTRAPYRRPERSAPRTRIGENPRSRPRWSSIGHCGRRRHRYSGRRAVIGGTCIARRAGMYVARNATTARNAMAAANVVGSVGVTP